MKITRSILVRFVVAAFALLLSFSAIPSVAATALSLKVKAVNENNEPLKGAKFVIRGTGDSQGTDCNAVTGEDGIAEFIGIAENGNFEVYQETAPNGYLPCENTVNITIQNGVIYIAVDNEFAMYDNTPIIFTDKLIKYETVTVPIFVEVKQTGEKTPPKETFKFKVDVRDAADNVDIKMEKNTVETNGKGTYRGEIKFSVPENILAVLTDGFVIYQESGNSEGWTYSKEKYTAFLEIDYSTDNPTTSVTRFAKFSTDSSVQGDDLDKAVFVNSYNKANQQIIKDAEIKSPKTGENYVIIGIVFSALIVSCLSATAFVLNKAK